MVSKSMGAHLAALTILWTVGYVKRTWKYSAQMSEVLAKYFTVYTCQADQTVLRPMSYSYVYEDTDIFVATIGRSGTMFIMNMLHQLRTGGDETFTAVELLGTLFVPFYARKLKELILPQAGAPPRLFFNHGMPQHTPDANFTIYVQRDPHDVGISWYWFLLQFLGQEDMPDLEEFYFNCLRKHCSWPQDSLLVHVSEWKKAAQHRNVMFLQFEDFHDADDEAVFKLLLKIQKFLSPIPKMRRNPYDILEKVSYKFFEKHPHITDLHTHNNYFDQDWFLCGGSGMTSRRRSHGIRTSHQLKRTVELPPSAKAHIKRTWERIVQPVLGFSSYEDFLKHWKVSQKYEDV